MPHATAPSLGFQAFVLCGPGASLNTFTSNPKDFPKALVPIANRPMLWYPLDWCYRMGLTNILLISPPESAAAIETALSQNPHLTSLHSHKPDIIAPEGLTQTNSTGEIFRLPEVQDAVVGNFIVLPCDIVCELDGLSLLKEWMIHEAALGGGTAGTAVADTSKADSGYGEGLARGGGLGVWYQTKGEGSVKGEETDFIATTAMPSAIVAPPQGSLRPAISQLVYSLPTDTLRDVTEANKGLPLRHSLLKRHSRLKLDTTYRDAHIYFFPHWVLELMKNEKLDSISEDVVGWWAKGSWQEGLGDKLLGRRIHPNSSSIRAEEGLNTSTAALEAMLDDDIDLARMTSTAYIQRPAGGQLRDDAVGAHGSKDPETLTTAGGVLPPILAYVQPSQPSLPLVRRVDTAALLLSVSLRLAKLPSVEEVGRTAASAFAHAAKISHPERIPKRCTVNAADTLVAENVSVEEKVNIKESVIGPNCTIGEGARLLRCLVMEGAVIGPNCQLTGCIIGRRSKLEGGSAKDDAKTNLKECEVQEGYVVAWGTDAKNEKFMAFEGLSDDADMEEDANGLDNGRNENGQEPRGD